VSQRFRGFFVGRYHRGKQPGKVKRARLSYLYGMKKTGLLLWGIALSTMLCSQTNSPGKPAKNDSTMQTEKMKVEIWSDIMCPFCYIGKRHFEAALAQFPDKDKIDLQWKSFQLDPGITAQPGKDVYTYLAERKGMSREQSVQMHKQVVDMASNAGLNYDFDKAVIANSFDAHRFIQYAKTKGLGDAAEEHLFKAYFTEGKNVADFDVLAAIGVAIGLDKEEVLKVLNSDAFSNEVDFDISEASQIGVRGVPFFVMNRKYAVSGAQPVDAFMQTLKVSVDEWKKENPARELIVTEGASCTPDGECK